MKEKVTDGLLAVAVPLACFALAALANLIQLGWQTPDNRFWLDTALYTVMQMAFFLSFKWLFKKRTHESAKIAEAEKTYRLQYNAYLENSNYEELEQYIEREYRERVLKFVRQNLDRAKISVEDWEIHYKANPKNIFKDHISFTQRKELLRVMRWKRIKRVRSRDLLPNVCNSTEFRPMRSSEEKTEKRITVQKLAVGLAIAFAGASIVVTTDIQGDAVQILFGLVLKFVMGIWQIFMARYTAQVLAKVYVNSLAEKSVFFDNFFHATGFDFMKYLNQRTN